MIKAIIRTDTDQIVGIGECHLGTELSMDRITEEGCNMLIIIEMTLEEEILEECKIIEASIIEVDIEAVIEMITLEEVEVGLEKDNSQVILEGMIEAVVEDQDKVQEPVLIEIEVDVLNVGNMIILLKTFQTQKQKESQNKYSRYMV